MLLPLAELSRVQLQFDIDVDCALTLDRQRLRQVIMNLASNAIKYNHPGGTVTFSVGRIAHNGGLLVSIADNGPGMSAQEQARLFQPFERLGRETGAIEGTGLGLIITRSLVHAMGGRMQLLSEPGRGTTVHLLWPDEAGPAPQSTRFGLPEADLALTLPPDTNAEMMSVPDSAAPTPGDAPALPPLKVLYVEDNRINAMLFEEALRPFSQIDLAIAEDGQEALEMARHRLPDVLVLDAHLPGMSGFDVLQALRRLPGLADTPAYMCSADAMPDDIEKAKAAGFAGYWTKPIDILAVTAELCRLAERNGPAT